MEWDKLYDQSNQPTLKDIGEFIDNELWQKLNLFLQETYDVLPKLTYSKCSMQRGWNVKYQKSGKSLCTLYPMQGYFIALVVIGEKEMLETEILLPLLSDYTQSLYKQTAYSAGGRWLMINVINAQILDDIKKLIQLRVKPKNSKNLPQI